MAQLPQPKNLSQRIGVLLGSLYLAQLPLVVGTNALARLGLIEVLLVQ